jgi:flagellar biosynthesis/type III secretory pathway protein FliH
MAMNWSDPRAQQTTPTTPDWGVASTEDLRPLPMDFETDPRLAARAAKAEPPIDIPALIRVAREEGRAEAWEQARREAEQHERELQDAFLAEISAWSATVESALERIRSQAGTFAIALGEQVATLLVRQCVHAIPDRALVLVESVLAEARDLHQVRLRVDPTTAEFAARAATADELGVLGVSFVADDHLQPGDCIAEGAEHEVIGELRQRIERIIELCQDDLLAHYDASYDEDPAAGTSAADSAAASSTASRTVPLPSDAEELGDAGRLPSSTSSQRDA